MKREEIEEIVKSEIKECISIGILVAFSTIGALVTIFYLIDFLVRFII
jgi:DNA-directed RNA polymerase subunit E'/Rpb7